jgi:hypothetical protein
MVAMSGHNNWYSTSYQPGQKNSDIDFSVAFHLTKPAQSMIFRDAADYTARALKENYKNLYLALSGGMDSEVVAEALYRNKVPFTPIIYKEETREHWYAMRWCKARDITPVILDVNDIKEDIVKFVIQKSRALDLSSTPWPFILYIKNYVESLGGNLITGEADLHLDTQEYNQAHGQPNLFEVPNWACFTEIENPGQHPGSFFLYTPEMMLSIVENTDQGLNTEEAKEKLYNIPFRIKTRGKDLTRQLPDWARQWGNGPGQRIHQWTKQDIIAQLKLNNQY